MNSRPQKQSMSELKFRRLMEHNQRLKEDLGRPRIRVSEASTRCVYLIRPSRSCSWTKYALLLQSDPLLQDNERSPRTLLPIIWHVLPGMCFLEFVHCISRLSLSDRCLSALSASTFLMFVRACTRRAFTSIGLLLHVRSYPHKAY